MTPVRIAAVAALLVSAVPPARAAEDPRPGSVARHGVWEGAFAAGADAAPDTAFALELTTPSGRKRTVPGFWDGGRTWKLRLRLDEPGKHTYTTASKPAVPGLDGISGAIEVAAARSDGPFLTHGPVGVAKSGTHLAHRDGTPFFFLADTVWTGPALSTADDWAVYLADRKKKGFTAVQFNVVSPWRTAPTDADGQTAYDVKDGKLVPNPRFFHRVDARLTAINRAGLLAVPVLCWAHKKGDAGVELTEEQVVALVKYQLARFHAHDALFILAGDNRYTPAEAEKWKRIGRAAFADFPGLPVTTHPTGMNFPWAGWEGETWLTVFGYQSGHGDDANTLKWIHSGPPAEYGRRKEHPRPVINLEPPYEGHNGYQSRKPHSDYSVRRATYWSLLNGPVAGVTYGGHGVWSWHARPGEQPTDHPGTGVAKVWREALDLPGAAQVGHARKLFGSLPWTELRPGPEYVTQATGAADPAKFVACAAAPKAGVYVYYFPAGARALVNLHVRGGGDRVRWFDPRTGGWGRPKDADPTRGPLDPPTDGDWILVVNP